MKYFDRIPVAMLAVAAVLMGLAPFYPQPHLLEKIGMLYAGNLVKPIDIFDLIWHGLFPVLLAVKLVRLQKSARSESQDK